MFGANLTSYCGISISVVTWIGRIMVPKDVHFSIPITCDYVTSHGKRDFTDVIKLRIL